jgi:hypothetical protein
MRSVARSARWSAGRRCGTASARSRCSQRVAGRLGDRGRPGERTGDRGVPCGGDAVRAVRGRGAGGGRGLGLAVVVDPLDGTTNYVHGSGRWGCRWRSWTRIGRCAGRSVAPFLARCGTRPRVGGRVGAGVGYRAVPGELAVPTSAVVATGFPFRRKERLTGTSGRCPAALEAFEDLRRPGAASLIWRGRRAECSTGSSSSGWPAWDVAARRACWCRSRGVVSDWDGGDGWLVATSWRGRFAVQGVLRSLLGRLVGRLTSRVEPRRRDTNGLTPDWPGGRARSCQRLTPEVSQPFDDLPIVPSSRRSCRQSVNALKDLDDKG